MEVPQRIKSQLAACMETPYLWHNCPPARADKTGRPMMDSDLGFMLGAGLVEWSDRFGGYVLTGPGRAAIRDYRPIATGSHSVARPRNV